MTRLLILLAALCLFVTPTAQYAQSEYECATLTDALDLSDLCESISACEDTDANCLQKGATVLLRVCRQSHLDNCEIRSILYWIINHHLQTDRWYLYHPDGFEPSFRAVVAAFDNGDYENAILEFEDVVNSENYTAYFTLEIAHGLLYYAAENYEEAFLHFSNSIDTERAIFNTRFSEFNNPIAYYHRGQIYRLWGDEDRALQDFYLYDTLVLPELKPLLPLAPFRITMQNPQTRILYPVYEYSSYLGRYADLTLREPRNVLISFANDDETLVASGLLERYEEDTPEILFLERDPENPSNYYLNLNVPDYAIKQDTYHLTITVTPTHLEYYEIIWHIEGSLDSVGVMLNASEPDVRQNLSNRLCDGNANSFMNIGDTVTNIYYELVLLSAPDEDNEIAVLYSPDFEDEANPFVVQDGPVCHDDKIWWQISNGSLTGWLYEVIDNDRAGYGEPTFAPVYYMMPADLLQLWNLGGGDILSFLPTPLEFLGITDDTD